MKILLRFVGGALLLAACSDDPDPVPNETSLVDSAQVAYHVTGMKKTASGAT